MDGQPTATELNEIKGRVATIRAVLENAGFLDSPGATTGTKIVRFIVKNSGATPKDMTIGQWNTVLATLDGLIKDDPAKAMEAVNDACGYSKAQIEEEAKAIEQARAGTMESTSFRQGSDPSTLAWNERMKEIFEARPDLLDLEQKLLSLGGQKTNMVVCAEPLLAPAEWMVRQLLHRGRSWDGAGVRLEEMQPCHCHENACELRVKGVGQVATGYALSGNDGMWRPHSWVISPNGQLIETTVIRPLYFGIVLTDGELVSLRPQELLEILLLKMLPKLKTPKLRGAAA